LKSPNYASFQADVAYGWGQGAAKSAAGYWEGETSESRIPWTDSAWNKAEKAQEEQGVKRLRKPEGAAQSGQASPAQVASCVEIRRRGNKPHGRVIR